MGFPDFIYKHIVPACFLAPLKPTFDLSDAQTVLVSPDPTTSTGSIAVMSQLFPCSLIGPLSPSPPDAVRVRPHAEDDSSQEGELLPPGGDLKRR